MERDGLRMCERRVRVVGLEPESALVLRAALATTMRTAAEVRRPLAVVFLRVEGLERVRAARGSQPAEELLTAIAGRAATASRTGFLGRVAREALLLVLPCVEALYAELIAARIEERVGEIAARLGAAVQAGVAQGSPREAADRLIARAAEASRHAGRSVVDLAAVAA